jgi:hypothetical protein
MASRKNRTARDETDEYPRGGHFTPEITDVRIENNDTGKMLQFTYHDPRAEVVQALSELSGPFRRDLLQRSTTLAIDMIIGGRQAGILSSLDEKIGLQGDLFDSKGREILAHFEKWANGFIDKDLRDSVMASSRQLEDVFEGYIGDKSGFSSLLTGLPIEVSNAIKEAFDPSVPNSSAARLIKEFGESVDASTVLANDLAKLFNPHDEASVISSMRRDLNPNVDGSPMAAVIAAIRENENRTREQLQSLSESILVLNERMNAKSRQPETTNTGLDFEFEVLDALSLISDTRPLELERTGNKVGVVPNSKAGDAVLTYTPGHKSEGRRIAVEVKHDKSYTSKKILEECQRVRENRSSTACLFVISKSKAPEGIPRISVHGQDVVVVVDELDELQHAILEGAVTVAEALIAGESHDRQEEWDSIATLVGRLNTEVKRHESIRKYATTAITANEKIKDESRRGIKKLNLASRELRALLGI